MHFFLSASTHDQDVFCFSPDKRPCNGFEEALDRYRELVPHLRLAGKLLYLVHPFNSIVHMFHLLFTLILNRANILCTNY